MEHVTTLTPAVKYATTPAYARARPAVSRQLVRKIPIEKWENCVVFPDKHARLVKKGEMKIFFYHPRPAGPTESTSATSTEAKGEKGAALSIWLGQTADRSAESQASRETR